MPAKLISLNLQPEEIRLLDDLVDHFKRQSVTPSKVNRSTVVRELMKRFAKELQKKEA